MDPFNVAPWLFFCAAERDQLAYQVRREVTEMELVGELEVDQQRAEAYTALAGRLIFTHEPGDE